MINRSITSDPPSPVPRLRALWPPPQPATLWPRLDSQSPSRLTQPVSLSRNTHVSVTTAAADTTIRDPSRLVCWLCAACRSELTNTEHYLLQWSMLQQMSSPLSAHAGEIATTVRPLEGRVCGDASSEASSDATEDLDLPQCKIRRNYNCSKCTFFTQNPRVYLTHTRDVHFERIKIYDCPQCVYASRHHQKLLRHIKMVHGPSSNTQTAKTVEDPPLMDDSTEVVERIEDMLEEVEDSSEIPDTEIADCEESLDRSVGLDTDRTLTDENTADVAKNKSIFFSCNKCNYMTHLRARFTKHVKYHSMPMTKCTLCDFRTPYKWNLDRHMKNHGGGGSFCCFMCNFTADIKQSLTVHEMNHHTSSVGQSPASRRRNRVGASDMFADAAASLITKEEEGSGDSRSSHSVPDLESQYTDMAEINIDSNEETNIDSNRKDDIQSGFEGPTLSNGEDTKFSSMYRKKPRPIPQLIPLNASTPNQKTSTCEPPQKKIKVDINSTTDSDDGQKCDNLDFPDNRNHIPINNTFTTKNECPPKKKNESFFDKLKQRLLHETGAEGSLICKNCGFESKCLSEHSVHEKNCSSQANRVVSNTSLSSLSSTRCQNCRHRCKSSADLYVHMQTCAIDNINDVEQSKGTRSQDVKKAETTDINSEPHPMENVVFVWNKIDQDSNKFETPLDININDDATMPPEINRTYDPNNVDALHDNEGVNLSPTQAVGKKVYKCPHCPFWASTASRFHVHIVGHLNKKPFECSLCKYKSNWRWDITKHIKLKSARDAEHNDATVLMTDETGRRNYSKYNKFLAMLTCNENGENDFQYIEQDSSSVATTMEIDDCNDNVTGDMQPLNLQTLQGESNIDDKGDDMKKSKKTLWKCKKCNYKDPSKEALLEHVREHSKQDNNQDDSRQAAKKGDMSKDLSDLAYRCGHCNQLSNWKHVIQRHCRLKHDGVIKVIATEKPKPDQGHGPLNDISHDFCNKCPFKTNDKKELTAHMLQHMPSPQSIFKCFFCDYFVKTEQELQQHLLLHGITEPEDYISKQTKRHKCTECPYETNSKSQFTYHEQFHRLSADTPYKCQECNYSVSKRHLLHQHMRVHGIIVQKSNSESEIVPSSSSTKCDSKYEYFNFLEDIPYVWVSAKEEFHKMFKCRYCSYVNSQKCKIPMHEKIHSVLVESSEIIKYKCLECKFTCDSALRLAEHSKIHSEIYGRIYFSVQTDVPDEIQLAKLREIIEEEKKNAVEGLNKDNISMKSNEDEKLLHFCKYCPARFFTESEILNHEKFHDLIFEQKCKLCEFSMPQENQLVNHRYIHSDEYQNKTKMLKLIHDTHPSHKEPILNFIHCQSTSDIMWIVPKKVDQGHSNSNNKKQQNEVKQFSKQYFCKLCPAKFLKNGALTYHLALHGGEGEYKCKKCNYTVKNIGNLAKHELLHEEENRAVNCDYESGEDIDFKNIPLSGTDLFQRKTEAQKRVLTDKDTLVKPNDHFPPVLHADPQFGYLMHGNPEFIYPTYLKNGRQKEKRYKCHKCPSAFEKREQYKIHLSLHGSKQRYKCELCDYSVKYYANYVQHMRKHQMNADAQAERKKGSEFADSENHDNNQEDCSDNIKLAIKTMPKGIPKSDFQQFSASDQQTLRLLQRRRSINSAIKDANTSETPTTKERKLHLCVFCPYSNQRQDALSNHYRRHDNNDIFNLGSHKCTHCDLTVVQSHLIREHLKSHFNHQKSAQPQCFAANQDVSFTISKIDDENLSTDINIMECDVKSKEDLSCADKIFVQMTSGEIAVE